MLTFLRSFGFWSKCRKVKKLDRWVPHELTTNQKTCHFEASSSLILHNNNEPFLDWIVTCDEKRILYNNWWWLAQWWDWEEAAKHFPRPNLLPVWSTTAFWIPAKPLHLRSMLSKLMRCTENYNACTWYWSKEWAQFFSMTMPNCMSHNQHFKSWMSWAASSAIFTWPLVNLLLLLQALWQLFARLSSILTTSSRQKMLSKNSSNLEAQIFTLQE